MLDSRFERKRRRTRRKAVWDQEMLGIIIRMD